MFQDQHYHLMKFQFNLLDKVFHLLQQGLLFNLQDILELKHKIKTYLQLSLYFFYNYLILNISLLFLVQLLILLILLLLLIVIFVLLLNVKLLIVLPQAPLQFFSFSFSRLVSSSYLLLKHLQLLINLLLLTIFFLQQLLTQ